MAYPQLRSIDKDHDRELEEEFENDEFDLNIYWKSKINSLPNLSKLALEYIWLPVSGVDVERSFSAYTNILSDRRHALYFREFNCCFVFFVF
jgi:hypothetical protein